jgi:uncharacterized membrane protein
MTWSNTMRRARSAGRMAVALGIAPASAFLGCSIDDRTVATRIDAGQGGSSSGNGAGGGDGGSAQPEGGSSGLAGSPEATGQAGSSDAGNTPADECGALGEGCCSAGAPCEAGLGCAAESERCTPCAAFTGVGILQDYTSSTVQDLSGDGRVVVGYAEDGAGRTMAFRRVWASAEGPVPLGVLAGGASSQANAVSRDGYAVVGQSESSAGLRGFRWSGALLDLGVWADGDLSSSAVDVSADGNAVLLMSVGADSSTLAYRWSLGAGTSPIIGMEEPRAISADGNVVLGNRLGVGNEAVITTADGLVVLGDLPEDTVSFARGLSADGNVAVGASGICGCRGVQWRDGVVGSADGLFRALDASADGSVLAGDSVAATCSGGKAALWRAGTGTEAVACDLLPAGLIPNGWSLSIVSSVSDDGRVIAGEGINPALATEGWVAVLGPDCR